MSSSPSQVIMSGSTSRVMSGSTSRVMSGSTSRVMEYDPFSQEFQADPFPVYRWMRDEAPVFYSQK